jgi:hypothetical protein
VIVVDVYKCTKDATLKKWLILLIFFLAVALVAVTWLLVVCLKRAGGAFGDLCRRGRPMGQQFLAPACA